MEIDGTKSIRFVATQVERLEVNKIEHITFSLTLRGVMDAGDL
jgi:hypothetical protein